MKAIAFRDEKLYRIKAEDYGADFHRAFGVVLHSIAKGIGIAVLVALVFITPPSISFRDWVKLLAPIAVVCSIWVGVADRRLYVCEIEIYPDRIIRHSGEKTLGIGEADVRSITEGSRWTPFGLVDGLTIRSKKASIFIPANANEYAEMKSKLGGWRPVPS